MPEFVHLHVHSHYTLLEATVTPTKLLKAVKDRGMRAVALTDRGNLFGAFELYSSAGDLSDKAKAAASKAADEAKKAREGATAAAGDATLASAADAAEARAAELMRAAKAEAVKPIIGCQVNVAPLGMKERIRDMHQLVLLATSEAGYRNLSRLVSRGWLEGFYFEPRVDLEAIREHAEGLICLTGAGKDGFLNRHLVAGATEEATRQLGLLKDAFGDRLYVELTDFGTEGPVSTIAGNIALARALDVPLVATNWVHYLERSDHRIHDVQLAIENATTVADHRRKRMPSPEFFLKSADEMAELFKDVPEAVANTLAIAERCSAKVIPTGQYYLPKFQCPEDEDENSMMHRLCLAGLTRRYGAAITDEHRERLVFELDTIEKMGFEAYFLIVADFINWAKNRGIPVGPGRGSAAGSLVSYCLGITDICPLRYGLLFERFLNPGRKSMPDIDVDFCKDRRGEVIEYVSEKYGRDAVTQIMTLGTMKARMAIKDVARAFEWTPEEAQELANLVPEDPSGKHDLLVCLGRKPLEKDVYGTVDAMLKRYEGDQRTRDVLDAALQLEKLGRSLGVHACGIIIAPGPVSSYVPVCKVKDKPATQYNMNQVEKCGLLKMDFLGLKTMSILKKCADIVRESEGIEIDYDRVPLDDQRTFAMLGQGDTLGVFQCESTGFQELIKLLKPDRFEDMIALVALYRPGPLQAGMHIQYCDRKHGREKVDYPHAVLERSLKETYGLYIYQEQVMNISRELCGFTPAEADDLRKAMGKKDINVLKKLEQKFVDGAWSNQQYPKDKCTDMWNKILGFASYCFNKSHSACYGLIAYWTAYMKANHYAAFMTANLIYEMDNKDKMTRFVEELRSKDIPVLPPDVNESGWEFTLVSGKAEDGSAETKVRYGFGGVKAVGEGAADHLIAKRREGGPFLSLFDLCERVDTRVINKRVIESLIKVGSLDSLHANRRSLFEAQDRAFDRGSRLAKTKAQNQETLFASFESDDSFKHATQGYPDVPDWSVDERLGFEKALTGYWISSHPLTDHLRVIERHHLTTTRELMNVATGWRITIAAVVLAKRVIKTKTGKTMAILSLEDQHGRFEAVLFPARPDRRGQIEPGAFEKFAHECEPDMVALFTGSVERRERRPARPTAPSGDEDAPPTDAADEGMAEPVAPTPAVEQLPSLNISDMIPMRLVTERLTREISLAFDCAQAGERQLAETELLLKEHPGSVPVTMRALTPDGIAVTVALGERWKVHACDEVVGGLRRIWGERQVGLKMGELGGGSSGGAPNGRGSQRREMEREAVS